MSAWEADLIPSASGRLTGSVAALSRNGQIDLSLAIDHATSDARYGWRVDTGTCDDAGQILGGTAAYPEVTPDAQGIGTADASIPGNLDIDGRYAARVFLVTGNGNPSEVACGQLQRIH